MLLWMWGVLIQHAGVSLATLIAFQVDLERAFGPYGGISPNSSRLPTCP